VQTEIRRNTEQSTQDSIGKGKKKSKSSARYAPKPLWKQKQDMIKTQELENFADEL